jgi:hypothetical protein
MFRKLVLMLCVVLLSAGIAAAQDVNDNKELKTQAASEDAKEKATAEKKEKSDDKKAEASTGSTDKGAKELSGMSIVGNDEAPKSLYIVPWKGSEIGAETNLDMMLTEDDVPVDRDVFMRLLEFYEVSTKK